MRSKSLRAKMFNRTVFNSKVASIVDGVRTPTKVRIASTSILKADFTVASNRKITLVFDHAVRSRACLLLADRLAVEVKRYRLACINAQRIVKRYVTDQFHFAACRNCTCKVKIDLAVNRSDCVINCRYFARRGFNLDVFHRKLTREFASGITTIEIAKRIVCISRTICAYIGLNFYVCCRKVRTGNRLRTIIVFCHTNNSAKATCGRSNRQAFYVRIHNIGNTFATIAKDTASAPERGRD